MQELLAGPREGLTEAEVLDSISWDHGMRTRFGVDVLNPDGTLLDPQPELLVEGGSISWSYRVPENVTGRATDTASVRRTADLRLAGDIGEFNVLAYHFRPWVETQSTSTGNWVRWNQGVFVSTLPSVAHDGVWLRRTLSLADKTHIWARELDDYYVVPFNRNIILFVREDILSTVFNETEFDLPASDTVVEEDMLFEPGTTYLDMMNEVLKHGGFDPLIANAEGQAYTRLSEEFEDKGIEQVYAPGGQIKVEAQIEPLLPEVPNVLVFAATNGPSLPEEGNGIRTLKNTGTGPGSIAARGGVEVRQRVEVDAKPGPPENPNQYLDAIAYAEAARYFAGGGLRFQGEIGLNPRHDDRDIIALVKPDFDIDNDTEEWIITSWSLNFGPIEDESDALMDIEAERRVRVRQLQEDYTFARSSIAYLDGVEHSVNEERIGEGGVLIEERTTNLLSRNQSMIETATGDWSGYASTRVRDENADHPAGAAAVKVEPASGNFEAGITLIGVGPWTGTLSLSVWVRPSHDRVRFRYRDNVAGNTWAFDEFTGLTPGEWVRLQATQTVPDGLNLDRLYVVSTIPPDGTNTTVDDFSWAAGFQLEDKPRSTQWQVGGTPRSVDILSIPPESINVGEGTIELDVRVDGRVRTPHDALAYRTLVGVHQQSNQVILLVRINPDKWQLNITDGSGTKSAQTLDDLSEGTHRFAIRWDGMSAELWIDGAEKFTVAVGPLVTPDAFELGRRPTSSDLLAANTNFKAIRVSDAAKSDSELADQGPLIIDGDTTWNFTWEW